MAGKKKQPRMSAKDLRKPRKKKVSPIVKDKIEYVDYKDVNLLRAFISDRAKIRGQRVSGNNRQQQRDVAKAIKLARELALIPYHQRVVSQRKGDRRRGRPDRDDSRSENMSDEDMDDVVMAETPADDFVEMTSDENSEIVEETMEEVVNE
ncbi:MAG: 30S ribosomal protein S18 [Acidimicrobiaceae bacterium]|nr:30S ribosomal protein S18 [Acidimicrobiaceae bacterium]|tara:strand:- start:327 stop:779 length:453 start_codon:yes stop_codon:yes gene_type:complete